MPQRPLSAAEKARLAELVAARTPFWKICELPDWDARRALNGQSVSDGVVAEDASASR